MIGEILIEAKAASELVAWLLGLSQAVAEGRDPTPEEKEQVRAIRLAREARWQAMLPKE